MYYKFKSETYLTGADFHSYNTRQKTDHRPFAHRLELSANLPKNIGPKLYNKLPLQIKLENSEKKFEKLLRSFLIERACYSVNEFLNAT